METDAGATGILIAHLGAFGSGELKTDIQSAFLKTKYQHIHHEYRSSHYRSICK